MKPRKREKLLLIVGKDNESNKEISKEIMLRGKRILA